MGRMSRLKDGSLRDPIPRRQISISMALDVFEAANKLPGEVFSHKVDFLMRDALSRVEEKEDLEVRVTALEEELAALKLGMAFNG